MAAARRGLAWGAIAALLVLAGATAGWLLGRQDAARAERAARVPPVLFRAPAYRDLIDQNGATVSSSAFRGKVQVVTFLFPYCDTFCPVIAAHLVGFENMLAATPLAGRVEVVSFNVDPGGTGPRQMRDFLREYGWNPANPHWEYLTGRPEQIRRVVTAGFHVDYQKVKDTGPDDSADQATPALAVAGSDPQPIVANPLATRARVHYDITHEDVMMVVDGQGRVRAIYDQADAVGQFALFDKVKAVLAATR